MVSYCYQQRYIRDSLNLFIEIPVYEMKVYTVDAFTDSPFTGNPAAVVPLDKVSSFYRNSDISNKT